MNPDGLHERRVISINNEWPPPPVKVHVNDTLVIHVHNNLKEPTVVHAHGLFQNEGTNGADGAGMVTQCPIPQGHSFTYEYPVTQAGTFWLHSHFKVQYMDGLRVPLIVYDNDDYFDYDEDEVITLSDWYHEDSYTNLEQYMNKNNLEGVEPIPQSGLVNDHVNSSITFKPNKVYRLRIINMSGIATFHFAIDGHNLQVIEVDGVSTKPLDSQKIYLAAGQRVSVLVKTKGTTEFNYFIRGDMAPVMFDYIPDDLNLNVDIPVYYDRSSPFAPKDKDSHEPYRYDDAFIAPLHPEPALVPDRSVNMTIDFMENTDGLNHGVINNLPYLPPLVPTLHTLLSIEEDLVDDVRVYGPQSLTYIYDLDQVIELVINNFDDGPHPFHLHGHIFQVIARGKGTFTTTTPLDDVPKNPTYRDTIGVPSNGYVVLRFKANNPGVWFFHCHVDWHVPAGLAATFITAPRLARKNLSPLPQPLIDLCTASGLPALGNAAGKKGLDLEGAPDGIHPVHNTFVLGCIIATLVGLSTIIWHTWVDPGHDEDDEEEERENELDMQPLLEKEGKEK